MPDFMAVPVNWGAKASAAATADPSGNTFRKAVHYSALLSVHHDDVPTRPLARRSLQAHLQRFERLRGAQEGAANTW